MNPIERHVAGAIVQHKGVFSEIAVPVSDIPLPLETIQKWVRPLYFGLNKPHISAFLDENLSDASDDLIEQLLMQFDWRSRVAGALLVALRQREGFLEQISRLFLRSDVCYAGASYCQVLASFNQPSSIEVLKTYLDYYLEQKDLWFDQSSAMAALAYLDEKNHTDEVSQYKTKWTAFIINKPSWDLDRTVHHFSGQMDLLNRFRESPHNRAGGR